MRTSKWSVLGAVSIASFGVVVACGGGKNGDAAKAPGPSPSATPADPGSSGGTSELGSTTTTTTLGDGGDLSGAKLSTANKKEVETKGAGTKPTPAGEPGRKREDIQTIVLARREEARVCYDNALKKNPGLEGDLDVKFLIDPAGVVTEAEVDHAKSTIHDDAVSKCVVDVIKKIKFNASAKGFETRANYPFNFHPKTFGAGGKDAGK